MTTTPGADASTNKSLYDRLRAKSKQIEVDGVMYWRVEGDMLLDDDQLLVYAEQQEALRRARDAAMAVQNVGMELIGITQPSAELIGITQNNRIVRWAPGLDLTYCVRRDTFTIGGQAGYDLVVQSMQTATKDWENACGVRFVYKAKQDKAILPKGVLFTVREINAGGQFIASAFFPNDPVSRRRVLIDPSFYEADLGFDKAGVLRHELGHVLGFRHEHISSGAPAGCPDEDTFGTINLTDYDPQSVMHYFCGGVGSPTLSITPKDKDGAQKVYGQPLSAYVLIK
jgi:hypothetical protein